MLKLCGLLIRNKRLKLGELLECEVYANEKLLLLECAHMSLTPEFWAEHTKEQEPLIKHDHDNRKAKGFRVDDFRKETP